MDSQSGNVINFLINTSQAGELRALLQFLEQEGLQTAEERTLLSDLENLSLSNSSLEEVFMELAS